MDEKTSVEVTGEDVEAAIASGLEQLGVSPNDVLVEVLEESSRGVFGIGARPARVRLKLLRPPAPNTPPPAPAEPDVEPDLPAQVVEVEEDIDDLDEEDDEDWDDDDYNYVVEETEDVPGEDGEVGKEVLLELLTRMGVDAQVTVRRAEAQRSGEKAPWLLDVTGHNMNLLIGRKGETLDALQYITRLITSRKLQRRANIVVDAGGYKSQRSQRLRQLAVRMADQAVHESKTIALEPMPPNERRIIHLTLRNRDDVTTRSTGEGTGRKVTIVPK